MSKKDIRAVNIIAQNRKARHNFFITDHLEAGIILMGSELKSIRNGKANIEEAYATEQNGELFLLNAFISEYAQAKHFSHEPKRPRKLLLKKKEINKLMGAIKRQGITLIPLSFYFNEQGRIKVDLGVALGKKQHDKREHDKERDWSLQKARIMRARG